MCHRYAAKNKVIKAMLPYYQCYAPKKPNYADRKTEASQPHSGVCMVESTFGAESQPRSGDNMVESI